MEMLGVISKRRKLELIKKKIVCSFKKAVVAAALALGVMFAGQAVLENAEVSAYADTYGDFEYSTDYTNGGVYISSYKGTSATVTIPSTLNGKTVTKIGASAFWDKDTITKIVLPNTIKEIGNEAFTYCDMLTSVNIPSSVEKIGRAPFYGSSKCVVTVDSANKNFCIAGGVIFSKDNTVIVAGTEQIAAAYTIPSTVKTINAYAFTGLKKITSVTIPASVTSIETYAFQSVMNLTKITVAAANTKYSSDAIALFDKAKTSLIAYPTGKTGTYKIPSTVKTIAEASFYSAKLTSVAIPDSVTKIERYAFAYSELTGATISSKVSEIEDNAFYSASKLNSCSIASSETKIGKSAFKYTSWVENLSAQRSDKLAIHNGILLDGSGASGVVIVPYDIRNIVGGAFYFNSKITKLFIPNTVTQIGEDAMYNCSQLTDLYISANVTTMGEYAIASNDKLANIRFKGDKLSSGDDIAYSYLDKYTVYAPASAASKLKQVMRNADIKAISAISLNANNTVISNVKTISYTGFESMQPALVVKYNGVELKQGIDYIVYYKNNINMGTATLIVEGIGKYQGAAGSANFKITQTAISACTITGINAKTYTGNKITQSVVIKDGTKKLELNNDYTIEYQDNVKVGTAKVIITGKGKYAGTVTKNFTIKPVQVSSLSITGVTNKTYTGNNIFQSIVVKRGSKTLTKGTHYTLTYTNNKQIGKATVAITGKGVYAGTVYKTFTIRPKKVTNLKASSIGKASANLTWTKNAKASGYIILKYNTNKKEYVEVKTIKGASNTSYAAKSLTAGTTYKYKVVAYTDTTNGKVRSDGVTLSVTTKK